MSFTSSRRYVLMLALSASLGLAACGGGGSDSGSTDPGWSNVTTLKVVDVTVGTGTATASAIVPASNEPTVSYTLYLYDVRASDTRGTKVDSNASFKFMLGAGQVVAGFETGVTGMKVGGKRTVTVPAGLAYGTIGRGPIPPDAALVFDIELLKVE